MRLKYIALCALATVTLTAAAPPAKPQDSTFYVYCNLRDAVHSVAYFSSVFRGIPDPIVPYDERFHDYVFDHYNKVYGSATCSTSDSSYNAEREKANMQKRFRGLFRNFIETGWRD